MEYLDLRRFVFEHTNKLENKEFILSIKNRDEKFKIKILNNILYLYDNKNNLIKEFNLKEYSRSDLGVELRLTILKYLNIEGLITFIIE
ncbi:MAG: hypothetical protein SOV85_01905 [Clostridium sp.]|uniref:hypothetical protein n=1 Tax=Clostridium sp. TaxID=1506 RepID=UPI002A75F20D|nr:hypothetical protein [Clostridium sp.]MDY2630098.1 hypothetical protein [Clostridium sp.]